MATSVNTPPAPFPPSLNSCPGHSPKQENTEQPWGKAKAVDAFLLVFSILKHAVPTCVYTVERKHCEQQSWGSKDRPIPRCLSWCPQPSTHGLFLPQPPKAPLKIWLPECNLTAWPQSSSSKISSGLSEVFTFTCAKRALGNIIARGRSGLTGTRKSFSTRLKSPGWYPRQYMAQWQLLCA